MLGASGFVVSLIHLNPKPFIALKNAANAGDASRVKAIQEHIANVTKLADAQFKMRPSISMLYHILNHVLCGAGVCDNILLEHEGTCPPDLAKLADELVDILNAAESESQ